ncbi:uncharacterized protein LOC126676697 [Mercurialis annua]|uniref:uncharacterized protein LOC126676697 n=1 Tax=Mercurialis annua TaxID=3986 RepID=UPI00215DFE2A|nr:uncharacterized protein LOC126676697 [Mercurialis annua]
MADHYSFCLLGLMDRLWFNQIILFSESSSSTVLLPQTLKQQSSFITSSLNEFSSTSTLSSSKEGDDYDDEEVRVLTSNFSEDDVSSSSNSSSISLQFKKSNLGDKKEQEQDKERPTRLNVTTKRARSQSSSPSFAKRLTKNTGFSKVLQKSMSCRTLGELEVEEVKGFMDLGFIFKKEEINPRMISVLPGLSRFGLYEQKHEDDNDDDIVRDDDDELEQARGIIRPYLSEAWLIRRPDSPLLNLRMPRVPSAADMKKHLRSWARTVASEIQQQS